MSVSCSTALMLYCRPRYRDNKAFAGLVINEEMRLISCEAPQLPGGELAVGLWPSQSLSRIATQTV